MMIDKNLQLYYYYLCMFFLQNNIKIGSKYNRMLSVKELIFKNFLRSYLLYKNNKLCNSKKNNYGLIKLISRMDQLKQQANLTKEKIKVIRKYLLSRFASIQMNNSFFIKPMFMRDQFKYTLILQEEFIFTYLGAIGAIPMMSHAQKINFNKFVSLLFKYNRIIFLYYNKFLYILLSIKIIQRQISQYKLYWNSIAFLFAKFDVFYILLYTSLQHHSDTNFFYFKFIDSILKYNYLLLDSRLLIPINKNKYKNKRNKQKYPADNYIFKYVNNKFNNYSFRINVLFKSTKSNTRITIMFNNKMLCRFSCGLLGYKKSNRSTYLAANQLGFMVVKIVRRLILRYIVKKLKTNLFKQNIHLFTAKKYMEKEDVQNKIRQKRKRNKNKWKINIDKKGYFVNNFKHKRKRAFSAKNANFNLILSKQDRLVNSIKWPIPLEVPSGLYDIKYRAIGSKAINNLKYYTFFIENFYKMKSITVQSQAFKRIIKALNNCILSKSKYSKSKFEFHYPFIVKKLKQHLPYGVNTDLDNSINIYHRRIILYDKKFSFNYLLPNFQICLNYTGFGLGRKASSKPISSGLYFLIRNINDLRWKFRRSKTNRLRKLVHKYRNHKLQCMNCMHTNNISLVRSTKQQNTMHPKKKHFLMLKFARSNIYRINNLYCSLLKKKSDFDSYYFCRVISGLFIFKYVYFLLVSIKYYLKVKYCIKHLTFQYYPVLYRCLLCCHNLIYPMLNIYVLKHKLINFFLFRKFINLNFCCIFLNVLLVIFTNVKSIIVLSLLNYIADLFICIFNLLFSYVFNFIFFYKLTNSTNQKLHSYSEHNNLIIGYLYKFLMCLYSQFYDYNKQISCLLSNLYIYIKRLKINNYLLIEQLKMLLRKNIVNFFKLTSSLLYKNILLCNTKVNTFYLNYFFSAHVANLIYSTYKNVSIPHNGCRSRRLRRK